MTLNADGSFTYDPTSSQTLRSLGAGQTATDTFTYRANDGHGGTATATVTITVTEVNEPPVLASIEPGAVQYDAGTPAVAVTSTLSVSDPDDTNLAGATVKISAGFVSGEDSLSFINQNGITGSFASSTGVLTLTGSASVADYQAALRSVTYSDPNGTNPTTGTRTISFQADDGHTTSNLGNIVTRDITVNPNPPPTAVDDSASTDKHTAIDIPVLANDSDADGDTLHVDPASVDTTATKGSVSVNPDGTIHYDPNGQFESLNQGQSATDTFTYKASDGFHNSNPATVTVTITGANDPPVLASIESTPTSYRAQDPAVPITSSLTLSDDDDTSTSGATVSITSGFSSGEDQLQVTNQNGITGSYDSATGVLTLTGSASVADYQAALRSIKFFTSDRSVSPAARTISFVATDPNGAFSNSVSRTIDVSEANRPPIANTDSYSAVGNTTLAVGTTASSPAITVSAGSVLNNDSDPDSTDPLSVTANTSPAHGSVSMNSDGTFTYLPNAGFSGADSFTYTVTDSDAPANPKSSIGTVDITVGPVVWYVDNSLSSAGDGRSSSPFNTLAAANAAAGSNSIVFLYQGSGNYTGGVTMHSGEDLLGQPHGLTVDGNELVAAGGSMPTITNPGGDGIDLAEGVDVEGVNVSSPSGSGIAASNVNAATVGSVNAVQISSAGGDGIEITGGNGNLDFAQTSVTGAAGHSVSLANHTGGTISFGGAITDNGTGLSLSGNSGATINFGGRVTASTGTHSAFTATGGGTITATNTGNTLTSSTGTALNIANSTIGASGLTFQSISSNGASSGIVLNNTGSSGGLTVSGNGGTCTSTSSTCSGGTIQNTTGQAIALTSTQSPSFNFMKITNVALSGINGTGVTNFTLNNSVIDGVNTSHTATDSNVAFNLNGGGATENNLSGAVSITNNQLNNSYQFGIDIENYNGTISNLTLTGNSFTSSTNAANSFGSAIDVVANRSASNHASITQGSISGNTIQNFPNGAGIQVIGGNTPRQARRSRSPATLARC